MYKPIVAFIVVGGVTLGVLAYAGNRAANRVPAAAQSGRFTGYVTDLKCKRSVDAACNRRCFEAGEQPGLLLDGTNEVLRLRNADEVLKHPGGHVELTGTRSGDVIVVSTVRAILPPAATIAQDHQPASSTATTLAAPAAADAQKSFALLKTFSGTWQASITAPDEPATSTKQPPKSAANEVTIRVTSRGNAIVHELRDVSKPDDPAYFDHPLTMLYLDGENLALTHYCDTGNRPHMVAKASSDGKSVQFDMVDIVGPLNNGHMVRAAFTAIDDNHHTEDWTWEFPDGTPVKYHFDLHRKGPVKRESP